MTADRPTSETNESPDSNGEVLDSEAIAAGLTDTVVVRIDLESGAGSDENGS